MKSPAALALCLLLSLPALGQDPAPVPPPPPAQEERVGVAVLALESNEAARDAAPGVGALVASRLGEDRGLRIVTSADVDAVLSMERQRQLFGLGASCADAACADEVARTLGVRYVVSGRLDRFGETYVLSASLVEVGHPTSLVRPRAEAEDEAELPEAALQVGEALRRTLEAARNAPRGGDPLLSLRAERSRRGGFALGLRLDSTFISDLRALSPGGTVELGYRFHPEWVAFLQVGMRFVRGEGELNVPSGLNLVPGLVGARHLYETGSSLHPYWGLGLGVQLAFGPYGIFRETGPLPALFGMGGLQWQVTDGLGLLVEGRTNIAQATLGLAQGGQGDGLNFDLNLGFTYEF